MTPYEAAKISWMVKNGYAEWSLVVPDEFHFTDSGRRWLKLEEYGYAISVDEEYRTGRSWKVHSWTKVKPRRSGIQSWRCTDCSAEVHWTADYSYFGEPKYSNLGPRGIHYDCSIQLAMYIMES